MLSHALSPISKPCSLREPVTGHGVRVSSTVPSIHIARDYVGNRERRARLVFFWVVSRTVRFTARCTVASAVHETFSLHTVAPVTITIRCVCERLPPLPGAAPDRLGTTFKFLCRYDATFKR